MGNRFKSIFTKRNLKFLMLSIVLFIGLAALFAVFSNYKVENSAKDALYNHVDEIPHNKVGVVLGTAKYRADGGINYYFKHRIDATVSLYKSGKIDLILVSGDNSTKYYNEPEAFNNELIKQGIPAEKIFLDYAGFRTLDSMVRAWKVFGQKEFTVISQEFHNERALYLAQSFGIKAIGFNAKDVSRNYGFKTQVREYFARSKAVLDIVFGVEPKFLGEKVKME